MSPSACVVHCISRIGSPNAFPHFQMTAYFCIQINGIDGGAGAHFLGSMEAGEHKHIDGDKNIVEEVMGHDLA